MRTRLTDVLLWPVSTQREGRRNAHQAAIAMEHRRRERETADRDVDRLLAERSAHRRGASGER